MISVMELTALSICYLAATVGFTHGYENLALGKSTWQSTSYDSSVGSEKAVDGLKSDLSYSGKQCSISNDDQTTATWWVNLGSVCSIHNIIIYYRTDNLAWDRSNLFTSRFLGFSVYVSNTTEKITGFICFWDISYTRSTIPAIISISCPVQGQYVIFYNTRTAFNPYYRSGLSKHAYTELCEVEVFGCPLGKYGFLCEKKCSEHCLINNSCNITSGQCIDGCKPGWKGLLCDKECDKGQYGRNCGEVCGNCRYQHPCHKVNGTCRDGCIPGYKGDTCKEICNVGYYGDGCNFECSTSCKKTRDCDHLTGSCTDGCKTGWEGYDCFQAKEEHDWQSRFYGVLIVLSVCVVIITVLIVVLVRQRRHSSGVETRKTVRESQIPQCDISYVDLKAKENNETEYQELGDIKGPGTYDVIK